MEERDALLEALQFYLCCKTARDAIKASEGKAA
jgi:hypothetical protein